jgi:hypothetical protein
MSIRRGGCRGRVQLALSLPFALCFDGATTREAFEAYLEGVLMPLAWRSHLLLRSEARIGQKKPSSVPL